MAPRTLTRWLQVAHAGELGAAIAYRGHAFSVADPVERREIFAIEAEELDHRARLGRMLKIVGAGPDPVLEARTASIGRLISAFCRVGGWFLPMYGAGFIERLNIDEYRAAIAAAELEGRADFLGDLRDMEKVEREHERYFRAKAASHPLWGLLPHWAPPADRGEQVPGPLLQSARGLHVRPVR